MSTRAAIVLEGYPSPSSHWGDMEIGIDSDGYPSCIIDEVLLPLIKEIKKKVDRNPDVSLLQFLRMGLEEMEYTEGAQSGILDFVYKINKNGEIFWRYGSKTEWFTLEDWEKERMGGAT